MLQGKRRYFYFIINLLGYTKKYYIFEINPTPSDAIVNINGESTKSVTVPEGTKVDWSVSLNGYETKSGTEYVNSDLYKDVNLSKKSYTVNISPNPSNATVMINGVVQNSITVEYGSEISYIVSCDDYHSKQATVKVTDNMTIPVTLNKIVWNPFSKTAYVKSVTNSEYSALIDNGEVEISHPIRWDGADVDMGLFYFDPSVISQIPQDARISKVTVYYKYRQNRMSTSLYINRVRVKVFTGTDEKMAEYSTSPVGNTYIDGHNDVENVSRQDLSNGLSVHFTSYYKGNLSIKAYIKEVYAVIEGEYPS